jgi:hypothetical protein
MTEEAGHDGNQPDRGPWSAFDKALAEARSKFAGMTPEALEPLINEAVAAARTAPPAGHIDEGHVQAHTGHPSPA